MCKNLIPVPVGNSFAIRICESSTRNTDDIDKSSKSEEASRKKPDDSGSDFTDIETMNTTDSDKTDTSKNQCESPGVLARIIIDFLPCIDFLIILICSTIGTELSSVWNRISALSAKHVFASFSYRHLLAPVF